MVKQSDLVKPKSPEECGRHGNTDDEFEEYSEEEMLSEEELNENLCMPPNKEGSCAEEPNEDGSSDEESAEEVPCGDESDDEDSCPEPNVEDSDEEPEAASAEYPTEGTTLEEASDEDPTDVSSEEILEEFFEESDEEPNGEELLRGSTYQPPLVINSDGAPSLLEEKKSTDAIVSKQLDNPLASRKKRCSRWDIKAEAPMLVNESGGLDKKRKTRWSSDTKAEAPILVNDNADLNKRRKTRWSSDDTQLNMSCTLKLLDSVKDILSDTCNGRRIQRLNAKLQSINQKLEGGVIVDDQPQEESSPSPQSNNDDLDSRIDTREFRLRLRLLKRKQKIIKELTNSKKKDEPKHQSDHTIFHKKLYIPLKEYPNYNFIGLILGPNGNTLKKMEKETGAMIRLRGKGSNNKDKKINDDHDDMHVLVQADNQTSFDAAVSMVEKLLVPIDDQYNYHKAAQLRELAELRGTVKEGTSWVIKPCDICGKSSHPTSDCPLTATASQPNANFHTGSGSLFSSFKSPSLTPCPLPFVAKAYDEIPKKEIDPTNVYVCFLPLSVSTDKLKELFLPYGSVCGATVLTDKSTGLSRGCGFVKYTTTSDAAKAIEKMNGYMIDGRKLAVRIAGISPPSSNANLPTSDCALTATASQPNANFPTGSGTLFSSFKSPSLTPDPVPFMAKAYGDIPKKEINPTNLFVGQLPQSVSIDKLKELFLPYGSICGVTVLTDKNTGLSKGCGFVKYTTTSDAAKAIEKMNGYMIDGRKLTVSIAGTSPPSSIANLPNYPEFVFMPPPPSLNANLPTSDCPLTATASQPNANFHTGSGTLFSSFKSPSLTPCPVPFVAKAYGDIPKEINPASLFVGQLPQSVSNDKLKELFLPYGSLCGATVLTDKSTGLSKGCGFVKYTTTSDAAKAIEKMNGYMIDGRKLIVRIAGTSPPSLNANLPKYPEFVSIPPLPSLIANLPSFPGLASISPPSNANLPNYPELVAIPQEIRKQNSWPGPPGSILPESGTSFPKSSYNSLAYTESVPLPSSTSLGSTFQASLGKNAYMMDGKKLEVTVTGTPPPSLNANLPNYPGFAAIPREIPEPNCWPGPPGSILPESGTYFPKSSYNSLKYTESVPMRSSTYLGSTCQTSILSSQFPGVATSSNELASFPGYLKSLDPPSDHLDQSMPSSSLSSQAPYFIRNFSGNQMNPTWR